MTEVDLLPQAQRETLEYLRSLPPDAPTPSYRDLMRAFGLKSPAPVQQRLSRLAARGLISWEQGKVRTIRVLNPGCQWVSVPDDRVSLVEAVIDPTPDAIAVVEQWVAQYHKQRRLAAAANYDGVPAL